MIGEEGIPEGCCKICGDHLDFEEEFICGFCLHDEEIVSENQDCNDYK